MAMLWASYAFLNFQKCQDVTVALLASSARLGRENCIALTHYM